MWEDVKSGAPGSCAPYKSLAEARKDNTLSNLQTTVARHKAQQLFDELISKFNHRPPESRMQTMARLRSIACRLASAWLEAQPTAYPLRLSDGDFGAALR
jgi:hypothetical protein